MQHHPSAVGARRVLARAAAQILLKINALRYDAVMDPPFHLDLESLAQHPAATSRLYDILADVVAGLDPCDVMAATLEDQPLVNALRARLFLPKDTGRPPLTLAWTTNHLGTQPGLALFDDRLPPPTTDTPGPLTLVTLADVMEVMHLTGMGETRARFAVAALLRTHRAQSA